MSITSNGSVSIYYETFGAAADPVLVLVNGLGSQCINYRTEWCEMFATEGFHVVRFDNRDTGLSSGFEHVVADPAGAAAAVLAGQVPEVPYTLSDMADDVVAVLDDLGVERAHVMGLSLGGMIVQTLAIDHPERLRSLTSVMSSTGDADVGQASDAARALLFGPPATDRDDYVAKHLAGLRVWGSPGLVDEAAQTRFAGEAFDRSFRPSGPGRQMMAVVASGSRTAALRAVRVPTLVMHGSADTLIDPSGGRRTAEAVPGARFELMEGMGHDYPAVLWGRWVDVVAGHARAADAS